FTPSGITLTLSAISGSGVTATATGGAPFLSSHIGLNINNDFGHAGASTITGFTSTTEVTITITTPFEDTVAEPGGRRDGGPQNGGVFFNAYACGRRNCRSLNGDRSHILTFQSKNITIRENFVY